MARGPPRGCGVTKYVGPATVALLALTALALIASGEAQTLQWARTFGTAGNDVASDVAVDSSGSVYAAGGLFGGQATDSVFLRKYSDNGAELWTRQIATDYGDAGISVGSDISNNIYLVGYAGVQDIFVRKYDEAGNELWTVEFGSSGSQISDVYVSPQGDTYIAGNTFGSLPGNTYFGGFGDGYAAKVSSSGSLAWVRQVGTSGTDSAKAVGADAVGNAYVAGQYGNEPFVAKVDLAGNLSWLGQFGSSALDNAEAVAVGPSGVFVAGWTEGALPGQTSLGGEDAFIRKYSASGDEEWTRQFGTAQVDSAKLLSVDSTGFVYVGGQTTGTLGGQSAGGVYIRKYSDSGAPVWTQQVGGGGVDDIYDLALSSASEVFLFGITDGALPGQTSAGGYDMFLVEMDQTGSLGFTTQFGSSGSDTPKQIALDSGAVYVSGGVQGPLLGEPYHGGDGDGFIAKFGPIATPTPTPTPTAMPTPTPAAVGGIVQIRTNADASPAEGGPSDARTLPVAAGSVAVGLLLLGAGGLYVVRMRRG